MMKLKTVAELIKSGRLLLLLRFKRMFTSFYRLCFFASMADSVIMEQLSRGPVPVEKLTAGFEQNLAINLIPGDKYYAFVGYKS